MSFYKFGKIMVRFRNNGCTVLFREIEEFGVVKLKKGSIDLVFVETY